METKEIMYYEEPGPSNTDQILELARKRVEALGIRHVIMAAQTGFAVKKFLGLARGLDVNIVAVTNAKGAKMAVSNLYSKYEEPRRIKEDCLKQNAQYLPVSISDEDRACFEREGVKVFYVPDVFGIGGLGPEARREATSKLNRFLPGHLRPLDIETGEDLSLFNIISMGFRVLVGITVIAVNNGLVPEGETALSIAGTGFAGGGADTAAILRVGRTARGCLIREILGFPKLK
ncbi:MAG TPA: hypothetical protein VMT62_13985 [Syntrophorhabdaceae bacterium]|nr:hypothetical protein [Syntrophorhabdaceae bacterium]